MLVSLGDELRLRRLTCGKAVPFRRTPDLCNFVRRGWKAKPSSRRGGRGGAALTGKPEAFRKSGRQSRFEER